MNSIALDNSEITATYLFNECLKILDINKIQNYIWIHIWTIKRWVNTNKVPENYYNDLNTLLWFKYKVKNEFRDKDQFFTNKKISKYCFEKTKKVLKSLNINDKEYTYIEPSAWCCNFYNILPKSRRIGIDIDPKDNIDDIVKKDYLNYKPKEKGKFIVIWNPPFWLRWNLALRFINHSYEFADIVSFILPPLFNSDWKWVAKKRVKWYELAYSEDLPLNSFEYPNWDEVKVATIFQIWVKINTNLIKKEEVKTCNNYIKVYSLSDWWTPSSTRNKKMLNKCDVYLPSTCFKWMKLYYNFEDLPNRRWYWIVFLKNKDLFLELFSKKINWEKVSFLSTNSALNLRKSLIENEVIKKGFID